MKNIINLECWVWVLPLPYSVQHRSCVLWAQPVLWQQQHEDLHSALPIPCHQQRRELPGTGLSIPSLVFALEGQGRCSQKG